MDLQKPDDREPFSAKDSHSVILHKKFVLFEMSQPDGEAPMR